MKSIIGLVVASLLVAVIVAIAVPNAVQANPKHQWCFTDVGPRDVCGFESHKECKTAADLAHAEEKCFKKPFS